MIGRAVVFIKLRDTAKKAPSDFSHVVLRFKAENWDLTMGKTAPFWDCCYELEAIRTATVQDKGFKTILMHKLQFAKDNLCYPLEHSNELWNETEENMEQEDKLFDGPDRALRQYMKVEV